MDMCMMFVWVCVLVCIADILNILKYLMVKNNIEFVVAY